MIGVNLDQGQRQRPKQHEPPWLRRVTKKVEHQRREVNRLQTINRVQGVEITKTQAWLLASYHVPERPIQATWKDAKQKFIAFAANRAYK